MESLVKGGIPDKKLAFPLMSKGERFIRCMEREHIGRCMEREHRGMIPRGAMVTGGA
jgi:hypothetical protein